MAFLRVPFVRFGQKLHWSMGDFDGENVLCRAGVNHHLQKKKDGMGLKVPVWHGFYREPKGKASMLGSKMAETPRLSQELWGQNGTKIRVPSQTTPRTLWKTWFQKQRPFGSFHVSLRECIHSRTYGKVVSRGP